MKKLLFTDDGQFIAFIGHSSADSVVFQTEKPQVEVVVDYEFEFDYNKKYSLKNGELCIEDCEILPPPVDSVEQDQINLSAEEKLEKLGLTKAELRELLEP